MSKVIAVADELAQIAGLFEKYRDTGASFEGAEAKFLASRLSACARQLHADADEHDLLMGHMLVEAGGAPKVDPGDRPRLMRGILDLIDGGRA